MTINIENLKLAVRLVRNLAPDQLNMDYIVDSGVPTVDAQDQTKPVSCGAIACVIGWCTAVPQFQALGVTWRKKVGLHIDGVKDYRFEGAAKRLFGVDEEQATDLFGVKGESNYDVGDNDSYGEDGENAHLTDMDVFEHRLQKFCDEQGIDMAIFDQP